MFFFLKMEIWFFWFDFLIAVFLATFYVKWVLFGGKCHMFGDVPKPKKYTCKNLEIFTDFRQPSDIIPSHEEWNFQAAQELGLLKRSALTLPSWDHTGEDPLEVSGKPNMGWRGTESLERNSRSWGPPCGNRPCDGHLKIWKGKFIFQSINFRGFLLLVSGRLNILQCNHSECEQMRHHNMNRFVFFSQQIQMQWVEEPPLMSLFSLHIVNHHWKKRHENDWSDNTQTLKLLYPTIMSGLSLNMKHSNKKNTLFSLLVRKRCIHLLKTRWCTMVLWQKHDDGAYVDYKIEALKNSLGQGGSEIILGHFGWCGYVSKILVQKGHEVSRGASWNLEHLWKTWTN